MKIHVVFQAMSYKATHFRPLLPWRCRQYDPPKRLCPSTRLQRVRTQKTVTPLFAFTWVRRTQKQVFVQIDFHKLEINNTKQIVGTLKLDKLWRHCTKHDVTWRSTSLVGAASRKVQRSRMIFHQVRIPFGVWMYVRLAYVIRSFQMVWCSERRVLWPVHITRARATAYIRYE
jgi:hypothetical protein